MFNKIISFFQKKQAAKYTAKIFKQKSWLDKQVDEAMRKLAYNLD
jgi:hypothetical protein